MDNIYGQTENERNSIAEIPSGYAEKAGNTLHSWLGSIWKDLHKGDRMIRGLQSARGVRLAQMYLDILEVAMLQDRANAPVFHRELWHPIVVRLSKRDTSQENMLKVGSDGVVGPQPAGSIYGEGTELFVGKLANFEDYVTYPIGTDIAGGAVSIVDNIVNPTVVMERGAGKDYEIVNGSIIFHRENDPLGEGSKFDRYDVPGVIDENGDEVSDMEAVLWASDVLIDKNYVSDHISYVLGANAPSSDVVKRILNAAWSSVASGLTPELTRTLLAALLNVPVIQHDRETVKDIFIEEDDDGNPVSRVVMTDLESYRVSLKAKLRGCVVPGAVLSRGDFIDESVRIYPYLNAEMSRVGVSDEIMRDIPSIVVPSGMIRAKTEHGLYAMWGEVDVKQDAGRPLDRNGNPRLYFDIGGSKEDVESFWEDVWNHAEESGTNMGDILGQSVSPAEFFVKNLVGANTLFVVVDRSQIDDASMMRDPMFFGMLTDVVPSGVRLFLVEHRAVGGGDFADLGGSGESANASAAVPGAVDVAERRHELVHMSFFRPPPARVRGKKEEEE